MPHESFSAAAASSTLYDNRRALKGAIEVLSTLRDAMKSAAESGSELDAIVDLGKYDVATRRCLEQNLTPGECKIRLCGGEVLIEEMEVPTLWRVTMNGQVSLVAALLPRSVEMFLARGVDAISIPEKKPEGLFAADPILAELSDALKKADLSQIPDLPEHQIDLSRQPLSPADLNYILVTLGQGEIEVELSGFAKSHIQSTRVRGLWRSRILNNAGKALMDSLVVAKIPPEVPAGREDIAPAAERLTEICTCLADDLEALD